MSRCFQIDPADNVATLLEDARSGVLEVVGGERTVCAMEPISMGHKVALCLIPLNGPVVKYGVTIGIATRDIRAGEWVHLHNCRSRLDERSQTFDPATGATRDVAYD
jgi:altronate dehydratase small subunit